MIENVNQLKIEEARKSWVIVFICLLLVLLSVFTLTLRWSWSRTVKIDAEKYDIAFPREFRYAVNCKLENNEYVFTGYACMSQEYTAWADCWVVLHCLITDEYVRIPTKAGLLDNRATYEINDGIIYGRAGISARIMTDKLTDKPESYELCFIYKSNGYNYLIGTGQPAFG